MKTTTKFILGILLKKAIESDQWTQREKTFFKDFKEKIYSNKVKIVD